MQIGAECAAAWVWTGGLGAVFESHVVQTDRIGGGVTVGSSPGVTVTLSGTGVTRAVAFAPAGANTVTIARVTSF